MIQEIILCFAGLGNLADPIIVRIGWCESSEHRKVYPPWGCYHSIKFCKHFQVKKLHINSDTKLSLQMHNKFAAHWVVVNGIAIVTNCEETFSFNNG